MNFVNPPAESPQNVTHKTFYSEVLNHELGYNIYLPPEYKKCDEKYPVAYHIYGCCQGFLWAAIWRFIMPLSIPNCSVP
jgi:enterochelin esterase-like enzyme